ncbi:glycosyltransferase [Candidatus Uhrbacteria bacterium]|nr:glycosyltransferase [Candidatus Uhrbacteria bacterium]
MRILLVNNLFGDNARGGAERVVWAEAQALSEAGHEVAVIRSSSGERREKWGGLTVFSLRSGNLFPYSDLGKHRSAARLVWHLVDLFNVRAVLDIRAIIRRFRPEVVHTHNLIGIGYLLPWLLRRSGIRHVHTLHDVQLLDPSGALRAAVDEPSLPFFSKRYSSVTRWLMGSPAVVISPSFFLLKAHRKYRFFPKSIGEVVANPLTGSEGSVPPSPDAESGGKGIGGDAPPVFLYAGQLEVQKGIPILLEAWAGWPGRREAVLEIAGDGNLRGEAETAVKSGPINIRYLGRLEGNELRDAYRRAAYTVLPSEIIENAPTAITEGYAQGVPAVAANTGGVPEMVEDGVTGFVFEPGNVGSLRESLDRAMDARKGGQWPALSEQSLKRAAGLSVEGHLRRLAGIYGGNFGK